MPPYPGFIGPSFASRSPFVNAERCVNYIPEKVKGTGRNPWALYRRHGLSAQPFATLPAAPVRGLFAENGRCFAVGGSRFCELHADGSVTNIGDVGGGGALVSMCSNGVGGHQILVISNGGGSIFDIVTNQIAPITSPNFPAQAAMAAFIDGYFIIEQANSNQFILSSLFDGTTYSGLDVAQRESASDTMVALVNNHRELWLFGNKRTEVWVNVGAADFPFQPYPGAFIEQGAIPGTIRALDNTLLWIGQDGDGFGIAWRAQGYTPMRVSTEGVEAAWQQYQTIADAEAFTEQMLGHPMWVINFPTAKATWVYDVSTQQWHERDYWNAATGQFEHARPRCHALAWGQHLVGDRLSGNIYLQGPQYLTDAGGVIRRRRRAPYLSEEKKRQFFSLFELDCSVGQGLPDPQTNPPTAPQVTLRYTNDGQTWSRDRTRSLGAPGAYDTRVRWSRCGSGRLRAFEVEIADPVDEVLIDAYVNGRAGRA